MEIYKTIENYEGLYQISNFGNVRSLKRIKISGRGGIQVVKERILAKVRCGHKYFYAHLCKNGVRKLFFIHKLVCIAFHGPRPKRYIVNHKNGNPEDNNAENLEWVTHKENLDHAIQHGLTSRIGEDNGNSKLKETDVIQIRNLIKSGKTPPEIASQFNVKELCIYRIANRTRWNHI